MVSLVKGTTIETSRTCPPPTDKHFLDNIYFAYYGKNSTYDFKDYHTISPWGKILFLLLLESTYICTGVTGGRHTSESVKGYNCLNTVWNIICTRDQISKHIKYTGVFH